MDNKKVAKYFSQIYKKKCSVTTQKIDYSESPTRCSSAVFALFCRKNFYENSENGHF